MRKYIVIIMVIAFVSSCSDFGDMNVNPKAPTAVPAETLFANATKNLTDQMTSTNVNINIFRLFAQHWTETTYTDEANYDLVTRDIPGNHWNVLYRDVLKDLDEARIVLMGTDDGTRQEVRDNQLALISVLEVFTYHVLVDTFGDVPYTQALDPDNVLPAYDNDEDIYDAIIMQLDDALGMITPGDESFGDSDLIYNGDMNGWWRFANSLKLRLAVRIAAVDPGRAATMASQAVASGVFTSNADNASFEYLDASPNTNPVWVDLVESQRQDFIPANTLTDIMNGLFDSRRDIYFDDNMGPGVYTGGVYGQNSPYGTHTHIGDLFHEPDTEALLMDYAEVEFLLAEAAELGLVGAPGDAEMHYNNAITASFAYWGAPNIALYLANPDVTYATAAPTWQETIAQQKWLALYNRGFEAWATYRLYGYPAMNIPPVSLEPVPRRYTYPIDEPTLNGASYNAAASAMGGDLKSSRVFWDVN